MTLRAKVNGRLRIVSKAMARRLRVRGVQVVDDSVAIEAPPVEVLPPGPDAIKTLVEQVAIVYPGVTNAELAARIDEKSFAAASATLKAEASQAIDTTAETPKVEASALAGQLDAWLEDAQRGTPAQPAADPVTDFDLSDDELERLTAPGGDSGKE